MGKKQIIGWLIALSFTFMLVGCGTSSTDQPNSQPQPEPGQNVIQKQSKYPFPENSEIKGNGQLIISTPSGTSEDGNIPLLFVDENAMLVQIGADLMNWDGDKEVFLYIDKFFVEADQVGEMSSISLDLEGDHLKPGFHTVSAIQFAENDPSKEVIGYQEATFEIKTSS